MPNVSVSGAAPAATLGSPRYRIAAVAQRTGVPEPTLRAWERRYGVPVPERTAAGYRLYGERDITLVREMRRRCAGGMATAEAARAARADAADAREVPDAHGGPGATRADPREDSRASPRPEDFDLAVASVMDAIERFDDRALDRQLRRTMYLGSATELLDHVLAPVLREVGERWHRGTLGVAQEHLASEKVGTVMRDLVRLLPGSSASRSVVLACFVDDAHELGLLGLSIRISERGLRPVFLGARTPPDAVRSAVRAASPEFVALSLTLTPSRVRARTLLGEYAAACAGVPWVVGGAGVGPVTGDVERLGGHAISGSGTALDAALGNLLRNRCSRREPRVSF